MVYVIQRKTKVGLALFGSVLALGVGLLAGPASAQAGISTYCGGWLGPWQTCTGAARQLYEVYGWGEQGNVCVEVVGYGPACSSGAGIGVYAGTGSPNNVQSRPWIKNATSGNNFVHGLAGTH